MLKDKPGFAKNEALFCRISFRRRSGKSRNFIACFARKQLSFLSGVLVKTQIWLLWIVFWVAGCSFAPPYQRPRQDLPGTWETAAENSIEVRWWRHFEDPLLDLLVAEALVHNRDIAAALARVEQAAANAGFVTSRLAPTPEATAARTQYWDSTRTAGAPPDGYQKYREYSLYLGASWELDFWGKYRNAAKAARAELAASEADRDTVFLLVTGNTVRSYFDLLGYEFQEKIAEKTLDQRLRALDFYRANEEFGFYSRTDLLRAASEVATTRYNLALARLGRDQAQSTLLLLLGRSPAAIMEDHQLATDRRLAALPSAPLVPAGLPSLLLERRPDLRSAEQDLIKAHFDIGVVRADYFPAVSLSGVYGSAAQGSHDLGREAAKSWSYGLSLRLPLDFWQTRFREQMADARCREAAANYEKAVQAAFKDVRDALTRQNYLADAATALTGRLENLEEAVAHAEDRYRNGYSSFIDLLDAERSLFDTQLNWAQNRTLHLHAMVDLIMALGGGWEDDPSNRPLLPRISTRDFPQGEQP